jgi:hypothetical protein
VVPFRNYDFDIVVYAIINEWLHPFFILTHNDNEVLFKKVVIGIGFALYELNHALCLVLLVAYYANDNCYNSVLVFPSLIVNILVYRQP